MSAAARPLEGCSATWYGRRLEQRAGSAVGADNDSLLKP
jgi:uncharacterized RmlC-like cupin family protein